MKIFMAFCIIYTLFIPSAFSGYDRNKAISVEKVLFGQVISVRNVTEKELIEDKNNGWQVFGGALLGGVIGNQFGKGHGRDLATILGALIGGSITKEHNQQRRVHTLHLVELMIKTDKAEEYMVIQDYDPHMVFSRFDKIRMIYFTNGFVRIDKQM